MPHLRNRSDLVVTRKLPHRPVRDVVDREQSVKIIVLKYRYRAGAVLFIDGRNYRQKVIRVYLVVVREHHIPYLRENIAPVCGNVDIKLLENAPRAVGQMSASDRNVCIVRILQVHKLRISVCTAHTVKIRILMPRNINSSHFYFLTPSV